MNKKTRDVEPLVAALTLAGIGRSRPFSRPRHTCGVCHREIGPGQGYREVNGSGRVHGACVKKAEDPRPGQDG